jgi:hypothetical protein
MAIVIMNIIQAAAYFFANCREQEVCGRGLKAKGSKLKGKKELFLKPAKWTIVLSFSIAQLCNVIRAK